MVVIVPQHHPSYVSYRCPHCLSRNTKIVKDSHSVLELEWVGPNNVFVDTWIGECEDCGKQFPCPLHKKVAIEEKITFKLS